MNHPTLTTREHVLTVRIDFDTYDLLKQLAKDNGTTVSDLVRVRIQAETKA